MLPNKAQKDNQLKQHKLILKLYVMDNSWSSQLLLSPFNNRKILKKSVLREITPIMEMEVDWTRHSHIRRQLEKYCQMISYGASNQDYLLHRDTHYLGSISEWVFLFFSFIKTLEDIIDLLRRARWEAMGLIQLKHLEQCLANK